MIPVGFIPIMTFNVMIASARFTAPSPLTSPIHVKGFKMFAVQSAVVPPPDPAQLHVHGPLPATTVGAPTLQRFAVGADVNVCPLDVPQIPDVDEGICSTTIDTP